ncbi:hypothetical protein B0A55_07235 [Friedmanniomyces simplex]|uniref:Endonuclease/exonuclease/phosphatase domain-containing protein n=1 Tax=Friedmanniomyces simplex TaxID=329884 RepID=A0A4V5NHT5_9PEZI|nr:hypothetical protein B0A55_07235 [Friedmanniomyces simplex]
MGTISPPPSKRQKLSESRAATSHTPAEPNLLSIYSHNVNGIAPYLQQSIKTFFQPSQGSQTADLEPTASLRHFLRRHGYPSVLFLQEVKINPHDRATMRALEKAVASGAATVDEPDYVVHVCLPSDKYNARGFGRKVYGVASIIRRDWFLQHVERVRPVSWDHEGRFLVVETKAIGPRPLAIFNIYAVNGTELPYKDVSGAVTGTRHDRKLHVHALLQAECRALEADGFGVILAGDMNIARSQLDGYPNLRTFPHQHCINRADFEKKFFASSSTSTATDSDESSTADRSSEQDAGGLGMVDTFRHLHPTKKAYTYYPRGKTFGESCDRVDMIMVSKSLEEDITAAGILETPAERGPSDPVPLFACFDFRGPEQTVPS